MLSIKYCNICAKCILIAGVCTKTGHDPLWYKGEDTPRELGWDVGSDTDVCLELNIKFSRYLKMHVINVHFLHVRNILIDNTIF